jgi:hypothetical protein
LQKSITARPRAARGAPALRLAFIRQLHVYVSLFVAPSLIFFAATGALQTFRIPDQKTAPVVVQKLARLHKDDVFAVKPPQPERPKAGHDGPPKPEKPKPPARPATEVMKWFFAAVSGAIAITTCLGVWMGLEHGRRKPLLWAVLIAGAATPVLIAML